MGTSVPSLVQSAMLGEDGKHRTERDKHAKGHQHIVGVDAKRTNKDE